MLSNVQLNFIPTAYNCLAWSKDGELAVGAGEFIHILVPAPSHSRKSGSEPWTTVHFRVNAFTHSEWPVLEPASFQHFSIGEEQSTSTVAALSWSPPGLAKHRRSVLAVLTSNLLLSLWSSISDPKDSKTWKRVLVINRALNVPEAPNLRQRRRIRAMSWAEPLGQKTSKWGRFILAVANDNDELIFILISNGQGGPVPANQYNAEVLQSILLDHDEEMASASGVFGARHFAEHLAWAPWKTEQQRHATLLTHTYNGKRRHLRVISCFDDHLETSPRTPNIELNELISTPETSSRDLGFALWHKQSDSDTTLTLVTSNSEEIKFFDWGSHSATKDPSQFENRRLAADDNRWSQSLGSNVEPVIYPWEPISGLAFCSEPSQTATYAYLATHLSHIEAFRILFKDQGRAFHNVTPYQSTLQRHMLQCRDDFDHENDLGGFSVMKTWGLASFDNHVAACITLQPGDMIHYIIPSQEQATIVFACHSANLRRSEEILTEVKTTQAKVRDEMLPWEKSCKLKNITDVHADILGNVLAYPHRPGPPKTKTDVSLSNRILCAAACASMFLWDEERSQRLHTAEQTLRHLENTNNLELRFEIETLSLLQASSLSHDHQATVALIEIREKNRTQEGLEICSICKQGIQWENLIDARCTGGHEFIRCALTFLPITEPGISKFCVKCNRQYLNEHILLQAIGKPLEERASSAERIATISSENSEGHVGNEEKQGTVMVESTTTPAKDLGGQGRNQISSLASLIFSHYDLCPYCGGKFID